MSSVQLINKDFRACQIPKGLVITDPPYNQGYKYNQYKDNLNQDDYINLLSQIPTPCVIIHYPEETINLLPKALNIPCQEVVSWFYSTRTRKQHRLISWWGCQPDFSKVREPYAPATLKDKRNQHKLKDGRSLKDYWEIPYVNNMNKEKTQHPCQIPEEIIRRIILITANPGDLIIDPFGGSGTTSKVANDLGFDTISYEMDETYFNIMSKRIFKNHSI